MRNSVIFLLALIMFSCNNAKKTPDYVIPHQDMVNIIVNMHITDGLLNINKVRRNLVKKDSLNFYDAVFKSFGYTRSDFDTSIFYYSNHISEYDKIYEEVLNKLSEMQTQLKEESANVSEISKNPKKKGRIENDYKD